MTGQTLIDDFALLVMKRSKDLSAELSAAQLSAIVTAAEALILNAVSVAPCEHAGSRYSKEGEDRQFCGVCSRQIEDDFSESLSEA